MWLFLPILQIIFNIALTKSESIEINHHNDMLLSPGNPYHPKALPSVQELAMRLKNSGVTNSKESNNWNNSGYKLDSTDFDVSDVGNDMIFNDFDDLQVNELDDMDIKKLSNFLSSLLTHPTWESPLVIVDDPLVLDDAEGDLNESDMSISKRSRYYRQYPWKRQNSRSRNNFDYESLHLCTPSREDVFQLLVALHEVRQGNKSRSVTFCKRRRPVGTIFTNIRFLGRRK